MRPNSFKKNVAIAASLIFASLGLSAQAAHAAPLSINLYEAIGYAPDEIKAFNVSQTQYQIVDVGGSTGPLLAKVAAEGTNPQWGLFWADGDTWAAAADTDGQLATLSFKPAYSQLGKRLAPKNNSYAITGSTVMVAGLYNAAKLPNPPATLNALLRSQYKGQIGMNDPNISGPTYPFIAGIMNQLGSEDAGKSYLLSLKKNGLAVNDRNGPTVHALEIGQINMGLVQNTAALAEIIKFTANPVKGYTPKIVYPGRPTLMPSSLAIDSKRPAAEIAGAQAFVKFVLSQAGQSILSTDDATQNSDVLCYPSIKGTTPNKYLPALPVAYQIVNPYVWGPLQSEIDAWFTANIRTK
jgi:iron(III) transport system substrate-binding protein